LRAAPREKRPLPRVFWLLFAGTILNKAGAFVIPVLAYYLTGPRHMSDAAAGLVVTCYGAGSVSAGFAGGLAADRVGRRATMLFSLFAGAVAMLGLGMARGLAGIAALAALMGFLAEMYRPAVAAMVADVVPPEDRQRAYALLYWAVNLGFAIAPTLGGLVAGVDYFLAFVVDAGTMVLYGVIVLAKVPESRPTGVARAHDDDGSMRPVFADRTFMLFLGLVFLTAFVMWQSGVGLPLDMKKKGLGPAEFGVLISINGVLIVLLQPWLARAVARYDRTPVFVASALLLGVGFGMHGLVSSAGGFALAIAIWTIAEIINVPVAQATVAELAPAHMRGRYQGANSMAWGLASLIAPTAGGAVLGHFGGGWLWAGCFAVCALAALGHVVGGRAREAHIARLAGSEAPPQKTQPRAPSLAAPAADS
jgi:MFS family permease